MHGRSRHTVHESPSERAHLQRAQPLPGERFVPRCAPSPRSTRSDPRSSSRQGDADAAPICPCCLREPVCLQEPVCEILSARACLREPVCESLSARARLWGNLGENASPDRPRWDMHGSRQSAIQPKPDRDLVRDKQMLRGLSFPAQARLGEPVCHTPIVDPLVRLCIPYFNSLLLLLLLMLLLLAS